MNTTLEVAKQNTGSSSPAVKGRFDLPSLEELAVPIGVGYQVGKTVTARFGAIPGVLSGVAALLLTSVLLTQVDEGRALKFLEKAGIKLALPSGSKA